MPKATANSHCHRRACSSAVVWTVCVASVQELFIIAYVTDNLMRNVIIDKTAEFIDSIHDKQFTFYFNCNIFHCLLKLKVQLPS